MSDEPIKRELDAREFRFVENYVVGGPGLAGNALQSAWKAGYTWETSNTWSSTWVRNPDTGKNPKPWVYDAIMARRKQIEEKYQLTKEQVMEEIAKLAAFNSADYMIVTEDGDPYLDVSKLTRDELAAIQEFTVEDYIEGRGEDARAVKRVKIKAYDKKGALELYGKGLGMFKTQVVHGGDAENPVHIVNHNLDLSLLTEEELATLIALQKKATRSVRPK